MRRASALLERLAAPPARTTQERYRHELKYLINEGEHAALVCRMAPAFKLDKHAQAGGYTIRSLYFDDYCNSAYEEKDAGILMRKKYRVRIYNGGDKVIKLERKKKYGSWIYKEDAPLTRSEFEQILAGDYDFLLRSPYPLCREFYIECICNVMRPRTIVDYEREPWVMDEGTVRITFDMNVRAAVGSFDIFAVTLVGMCVLTCMVTLAISTNVVISLGMVGALSIVRYRTAVKDPLDLLYLFWAITTGITAGAGMYALVGLTAVVIVVMIAGFASHQDKARVYMMVIHYTGQTTGDDIVRAFGRTKFSVKSKTMRGDKVEMAVEVFSDGVDMPYADAIRALDGVEDLTLIQYNGEYHG